MPDIRNLRGGRLADHMQFFMSICLDCGPLINVTVPSEIVSAGWRPEPLLDAAVEDHYRRFHGRS